jgi:hypothetical protein
VEINGRKQETYVSTTRETMHGVPQGSILGPILSLLYINDLLLNILESNSVLFADDTNILVSGENLNTGQSRLNNVMKDIQTWFTVNSVIVNAEKIIAISFHTTQNKRPALSHVLFEGRGIPYNNDTKFLGVYINENVKWINHIRYLSSKLNNKPLYNQLIKECNKCTCFKNHVLCMFSCPSEIWCDPVGR